MAEEYLTDDEQLEALKRWTSENGAWLLAGIVIGAAALFGYRYYDNYRNERDLNAAAAFGAMAAALDKNDRSGGQRIAETITHDYASTPYADQAELTLARLYLDASQPANAIAALTRVMNDSKDAELKNVARVRLARVLIDQGKPDEAIGILGGAAPGAFTGLYHEVRGDALYAKKDIAGAVSEYRLALGANESGGADASMLALKITDLGAAPEPVGAAPAPLVDKAKP